LDVSTRKGAKDMAARKKKKATRKKATKKKATRKKRK
jgi:hypothetical protein